MLLTDYLDFVACLRFDLFAQGLNYHASKCSQLCCCIDVHDGILAWHLRPSKLTVRFGNGSKNTFTAWTTCFSHPLQWCLENLRSLGRVFLTFLRSSFSRLKHHPCRPWLLLEHKLPIGDKCVPIVWGSWVFSVLIMYHSIIVVGRRMSCLQLLIMTYIRQGQGPCCTDAASLKVCLQDLQSDTFPATGNAVDCLWGQISCQKPKKLFMMHYSWCRPLGIGSTRSHARRYVLICQAPWYNFISFVNRVGVLHRFAELSIQISRCTRRAGQQWWLFYKMTRWSNNPESVAVLRSSAGASQHGPRDGECGGECYLWRIKPAYNHMMLLWWGSARPPSRWRCFLEKQVR